MIEEEKEELEGGKIKEENTFKTSVKRASSLL